MSTSTSTPPNPALAELLSIIGEANTREIVRTFLNEAPLLVQNLNGTERADRHRAAHSLKSSARLLGAHTVADHAARLEERLSRPGGEISRADVSALAEELLSAAPALSAFASP
jgi:HPt (histidine-containing phosphotransfer) domain-containing protein